MLGDSESCSSDTSKCEQVFISHIHAVGVLSGLRRMPAILYVIVKVNGETAKTSYKSVSEGRDEMEWDEEIVLPSETRTTISFKVYASFEPGPRRRNGVLLCQFKTTVGDVLDRNGELQPIRFLDKEVLLSCSSLIIIAEKRVYDTSNSARSHVAESATPNHLEQPFNIGLSALLRYHQLQNQKDLNEAITCFDRVRAKYPPDHPDHTAILFNLATARFIHCQDNNDYLGLDVPITLYHDALRLRTGSHPDNCITALDLCFALLAHLKRQKTDKTRAKDLPSKVVESYAYRVAWLALQVAGISVPMKMVTSGISQEKRATPHDELVRSTRVMLLGLSEWDSRRPAVLAGLGSLLFRRFEANGDIDDIHETISMFERALLLISDGHPQKPTLLSALADSLRCRYERLGGFGDLDRSVSMLREAVRLTPNGHPDKLVALNDLGSSLMRRYTRGGDLADVNASISVSEELVHLTPDGHPEKPQWLNNLASSLSCRIEYLDNLADINMSVSTSEEAVRLTPDGHPNKQAMLNNLGYSLFRRFKRLGNLADINKSILMSEKATHLTPSGHPDKPRRLSNLGSSLSCRFEHLGDLEDVQKSISMLEEAVHLTPAGHPDKVHRLANLGHSLFCRYKRFGDLADLSKFITMSEEAVDLTPNGHPDQPSLLSNLGNALLSRFRRLGDLADVNGSISILEEAVYLVPGGHSDMPIVLNSLANSLWSRFERLGHLVDINKSISTHEEALRLIPHDHPDRSQWLNGFGNTLSSRFERLGDPEDIDRSILVLDEALHLTPSGHPHRQLHLNSLGNSFLCRFQRFGNLPDINESNLRLEEAVHLTPNGHPDKQARLNNLGSALSCRFDHLGDLADINKSISTYEEAVRLTPNGHPDKLALLNNFGYSLFCRYIHFGDLTDINMSISVSEEAVHLTPNDHPDQPRRLNNLASSLSRRFECLGDLTDINRSILMLEEALRLTPTGHPDKHIHLNSLGNSLLRRFERLGDPTDVTASVLMFEDAARLTPDCDPHRPARLSNLGNSLIHRFKHLGDLADFKKSVSMFEEAAYLIPDGHPDKPASLKNLGNAYLVCFEHSGDQSHLSAAISHLSVASRATVGPASSRFQAARSWILSARLTGNSQTVFDACSIAVSLLPQLAWLGLPLLDRHRVLLQAADVARDATAAALEVGRPEKAVEWLEQGRSIAWSQLLQLRTPVDELLVEHPAIANEFRQISRELEYASSRDSTTFQRLQSGMAADARLFRDEVHKYHDLAFRRESLLSEIRSLPGFDRFLFPKTVEQLAASTYPRLVVYLNASKQRCDALIIRAGARNTISVSLPDTSYQVIELLQGILRLLLEKNHLIISRDDISAIIPPAGDTPSQMLLNSLFLDDDADRAVKAKPQRIMGYTPDDLFQKILAYLWINVVKPVLVALGLLTPPSDGDKLARIFWCPTGPFTFLPIHAAGLYGTAEAGRQLSHFAISSYIPTLGAISSPDQKALDRVSSNIYLVAVPQPPTDGLSQLVSVREEVNCIRTLSAMSPFVTLKDSDGTIEDIMEKMKRADWVHFACHGVQDPHNPLDSGLCLADRRRLKLSDIIRLSRPQGGLAFLSACQTAQGDEKLAEESVHLAAGMLLAGYGSVIATMWAIRDLDAPKVAKDVYEHLFRDGKVPDSTEAAEALHYAVQHLRDSGASFTSWVPFIHVGR